MIKGMFLLFTFSLIQGVQSDTVGNFEGLKDAVAANAGTITVNANIAFTERIVIAAGESVTIQASGAVVFDAGGSVSFFKVLNSGELHITGFTMQNVCAEARANVVESVYRLVLSTRFGAPEHFRLHFLVRHT